jgi:hypothetical protein
MPIPITPRSTAVEVLSQVEARLPEEVFEVALRYYPSGWEIHLVGDSDRAMDRLARHLASRQVEREEVPNPTLDHFERVLVHRRVKMRLVTLSKRITRVAGRVELEHLSTLDLG